MTENQILSSFALRPILIPDGRRVSAKDKGDVYKYDKNKTKKNHTNTYKNPSTNSTLPDGSGPRPKRHLKKKKTRKQKKTKTKNKKTPFSLILLECNFASNQQTKLADDDLAYRPPHRLCYQYVVMEPTSQRVERKYGPQVHPG